MKWSSDKLKTVAPESLGREFWISSRKMRRLLIRRIDSLAFRLLVTNDFDLDSHIVWPRLIKEARRLTGETDSQERMAGNVRIRRVNTSDLFIIEENTQRKKEEGLLGLTLFEWW